MGNTCQFNQDIRNISGSALIIDKIHKCADCPMRLMAIQQPQSTFARIHHWHKSWWPGWEAYQAREIACNAMTTTHI
jgi:hypothetical protein